MGDQTTLTDDSTGKKKPTATREEFGLSFWGTLKHLIEDVTTLEVATFTTQGDDKGEVALSVQEQVYHAHLQAYTKISLDADTVLMLPARMDGENHVIDHAIYDLHMEHVNMAKQTRQEMLKAMLDAVAGLTKVI